MNTIYFLSYFIYFFVLFCILYMIICVLYEKNLIHLIWIWYIFVSIWIIKIYSKNIRIIFIIPSIFLTKVLYLCLHFSIIQSFIQPNCWNDFYYFQFIIALIQHLLILIWNLILFFVFFPLFTIDDDFKELFLYLIILIYPTFLFYVYDHFFFSNIINIPYLLIFISHFIYVFSTLFILEIHQFFFSFILFSIFLLILLIQLLFQPL